MTVSATQERVWRVLTSFEEMPAHLSGLKRSRIVDCEDGHFLVEQVSKSVIPLLPLTFRVIMDVIEKKPFLYFKQRFGSFTEFSGHWHVGSSSHGPGSRVQYYLELGMGRGLKRRAVEQHLYRMIRENMRDLAVWIENP